MLQDNSKDWYFYFSNNPTQRFGPHLWRDIPKRNVMVWRPGMMFWANIISLQSPGVSIPNSPDSFNFSQILDVPANTNNSVNIIFPKNGRFPSQEEIDKLESLISSKTFPAFKRPSFLLKHIEEFIPRRISDLNCPKTSFPEPNGSEKRKQSFRFNSLKNLFCFPATGCFESNLVISLNKPSNPQKTCLKPLPLRQRDVYISLRDLFPCGNDNNPPQNDLVYFENFDIDLAVDAVVSKNSPKDEDFTSKLAESPLNKNRPEALKKRFRLKAKNKSHPGDLSDIVQKSKFRLRQSIKKTNKTRKIKIRFFTKSVPQSVEQTDSKSPLKDIKIAPETIKPQSVFEKDTPPNLDFIHYKGLEDFFERIIKAAKTTKTPHSKWYRNGCVLPHSFEVDLDQILERMVADDRLVVNPNDPFNPLHCHENIIANSSKYEAIKRPKSFEKEAETISLRATMKMGILPKKGNSQGVFVHPLDSDECSRFQIGINANKTDDADAYDLNVWHSFFATKLPKTFYRVRWTPGSLRAHHRPKLRPPKNGLARVKISPPGEKPRKGDRGSKDPHKYADLATPGADLVLFEYLEKSPPVIQNCGMATRICRYYALDKDEKEEAAEQKLQKKIFRGKIRPKVRIFGSSEAPPFFGKICAGQEVLATENNLFRAPICEHSTSGRDFLAVQTDESVWAARPISSAFVVGQQQPKRLVHSPKSASASQLVRKRISAIILEKFFESAEKSKKDTDSPVCVSYESLSREFDFHYEPLVKEELRLWANFERGTNGICSFKGSREILARSHLGIVSSPDDACLVESMRASEQKLHDFGITDLLRIKMDTVKKIEKDSNESLKKVTRFILRKLRDTPWNKTSVFNQARLRRCLLKTSERETPLRGDLGFVFEKVLSKRKKPTPAFLRKRQSLQRKSDEEDLRRISKTAAATVLRRMGVSASDLAGMERWDLVALIKELSVEDEDFAKYSRVSSTLKNEYDNEINRIFQEHLSFIKNESESQKVAEELEEYLQKKQNTSQNDKRRLPLIEEKLDEESVSRKDLKRVVNSILEESPPAKGERSLEGGQSALGGESLENAPRKKREKGKRYRRVVKKRMVLTVVRPIPGQDSLSEVITDTQEILNYLNAKREERQKELNALPLREKERKKSEFEQIRREQLRKLEMNRKNDLEKEKRAIQRSTTKAHIRCTECGMRGHIKTNRSLCLKFLKKRAAPLGPPEVSLVDTSSGDTIKINTAKVNKVVSKTKKKGKMRHIDFERAIDEGVDLAEHKDPCIEFRNILVEVLGRVKKWFPAETALFSTPEPAQNAEYYRRIKKPIDLPTILSRVENSARPYSPENGAKRRNKSQKKPEKQRYSSVDQFERDVELIFSNAAAFYGPREDCERSAKAFKLVESIKKRLQPHRRRLEFLGREISESQREQRLLDRLRVVLDAMAEDKSSFFFRHSPLHLANYAAIIKTPVCLDSIRENIERCHYAEVSEFVEDCHLLAQNARAYNEGNPIVIHQVEEMLKIGQNTLDKEYGALGKIDPKAKKSKLFPIPKFRKERVLNANFFEFSAYNNKLSPNNKSTSKRPNSFLGAQRAVRLPPKKRTKINKKAQQNKRLEQAEAPLTHRARPPGPNFFLD